MFSLNIPFAPTAPRPESFDQPEGSCVLAGLVPEVNGPAVLGPHQKDVLSAVVDPTVALRVAVVSVCAVAALVVTVGVDEATVALVVKVMSVEDPRVLDAVLESTWK